MDGYDIINGSGGGNHTISGFKVGTDVINPIGYGSDYTQQSVGGSTVLSLSDGTTITLLNVAHFTSGSLTSGFATQPRLQSNASEQRRL